MGLADHFRRLFGRRRSEGRSVPESRSRIAAPAPYRRDPMRRPEALDVMIDAGRFFRSRGMATEMELRPVGEGYSILVPAEQVRALVRIAARHVPPDCDSA